MKKVKKLIRSCANIKSAFTRKERFVDNYVVDPRPEQLDVRLKLVGENWEKYNIFQDELEELGHDGNSVMKWKEDIVT